jgi:hypothetical protein
MQHRQLNGSDKMTPLAMKVPKAYLRCKIRERETPAVDWKVDDCRDVRVGVLVKSVRADVSAVRDL